MTEEELDEESVYDEDSREDLVEDDEMSPREQAFMKGYEEAEEEKEKEEDEES